MEIYKDKKKEFRWRLKTKKGEIVGTSGQGYNRIDTARIMVSRLMKETSRFIVRYIENRKKFSWRFVARNGRIVACSHQTFKTTEESRKASEVFLKTLKSCKVIENL